MRIHRFSAAAIFLLAASLSSRVCAQVGQQGMVLFETFSFYECTDIKDFIPLVNQVVSDKSSKIIHLNHHVLNFNDSCKSDGSASDGVCGKLAPTGGTSENFDFGAVNRAPFAGAGVPSAKTETGLNFTDKTHYTQNGNFVSDMEAAIDAAPGSYPATITLNNATIDSSDQFNPYKLDMSITVAASGTISDKMILRLAVTEDNVKVKYCGINFTQNNVVRELTGQFTGVYQIFPAASQTVTNNYEIKIQRNILVPLNLKNMHLIAFLEDRSGSDTTIVNAVELRRRLDTLQAPAPAVAITNTFLDDSTFNVGSTVKIYWTSSNTPKGMQVWFSSDGGATWPTKIADPAYGSLSWVVPDTLTTMGKIKLISNDDPTVTSTEAKTFTIAFKAAIGLIHPPANGTDTLTAKSTYHIQWNMTGVTDVTVQYAIKTLTTPIWITIVSNTTASSYDWTVPDTPTFIFIHVIPGSDDHSGAAASASGDVMIKRTIGGGGGGVSEVNASPDFQIVAIRPNPGKTGGETHVSYAVAKPADVKFEVLNMLGHAVVTNSMSVIETGETALHTNSLAAGTYILRMSDGTHVAARKFEVK